MLKGVQMPRVKDKYGNNVKQHFGMWKYFINAKKVPMEREKFYISYDCFKLEGKKAMEQQNADK